MGPGKTEIYVTASITFHWSLFVRCSVYKKPKVKFILSSKEIEQTECNSFNSHTQDGTAPDRGVFLTGIVDYRHKHILVAYFLHVKPLPR
jgi:hypothetical protein